MTLNSGTTKLALFYNRNKSQGKDVTIANWGLWIKNIYVGGLMIDCKRVGSSVEDTLCKKQWDWLKKTE
jgi:hypothetical protein